MKKALVLDFGGVISKTLFETHDLTEKALDLTPGTLQWRGPFAPETDEPWQRMQVGEITERDYWALRMEETAALVRADWTAFPDFLSAVRGTDPAAIIRPEALAAFKEAKDMGCRLAVLSNELDLFYGKDFRAKLPFLADFDVIVDATYTKILKPDPLAFGFVTDALGLPAESCLFVDDQKKNLRGAKEVGMPFVHFDVTNPGQSYSDALTLLKSKD